MIEFETMNLKALRGELSLRKTKLRKITTEMHFHERRAVALSSSVDRIQRWVDEAQEQIAKKRMEQLRLTITAGAS